ncbi:hypothetical protein M885DRAFT_588742 [Pelagophyceae sp. CCMP2097]|nr:hypothetical protein M885DRAFT_588742 [Pelagophyceae sp. CCMP2097]
MTDDEDIINDISRVSATLGVNIFHVAPGRALVSTSDVNRKGQGVSKHQGQCVKTMKGRKAGDPVPTHCRMDYLRDPLTGKSVGSEELVQWLVTWEIMAETEVFVGRPTQSFFARFIFPWLCNRRRKCPR